MPTPANQARAFRTQLAGPRPRWDRGSAVRVWRQRLTAALVPRVGSPPTAEGRALKLAGLMYDDWRRFHDFNLLAMSYNPTLPMQLLAVRELADYIRGQREREAWYRAYGKVRREHGLNININAPEIQIKRVDEMMESLMPMCSSHDL